MFFLRFLMNSEQISVGDHREIALQLLDELNSLDVNSRTARVIRNMIAGHLIDGGANITTCDKCGMYKWERRRKNDMWKNAIHDPYTCPSTHNLINNVPKIRVIQESTRMGKSQQTKFFPDMGILRR